MFATILLIISVYWIAVALLGYYIVTKTIRRNRNHPKIIVPQEVQGLLRQDFNQWDERAIIMGCFFRMPFKCAVFASYLFWLSFLSLLNLKIGMPAKVVEFCRINFGRLTNRVLFNLEEHFDWREEINTPVVISNHTSVMDGNYLGSCFRVLSAVAKAEARKTPLFGRFMEYSKCLFVDRSNPGQRGAIFSDIKTRIEQFKKGVDKSAYPILIFPEGTCSNGRGILQFKKGAFDNLTPITIFSMRYQCKGFHMGQDEVDQPSLIFIAMCLNPKLVVKKQVLEAHKAETSEEYKERCRDSLAEMCGFKKYEANFNDFLAYREQKKEVVREMREKKAS